MRFEEFEYSRVDMEAFEKEFKDLLGSFKAADSFERQDEIMTQINEMRNNFETMHALVSVRHSIDTNDAFYDKENEYYDNVSPVYQGLIDSYYKELVSSRFSKELEQKWGKLLFTIAETALKTFDPIIIPDLQEENKLTSQYGKLLASAKIEFDGKINNLSQMGPYTQSMDRMTRKSASEAVTRFFEVNEKELDEIYDKLVKLRHQMALKLGYENYVKLGYLRLGRFEYGPEEVAVFRKQVENNLVPITIELRKRQADRLGIEKMMYYDENLEFNSGNATPKGDMEWMVKHASTMYSELSAETKEFFDFMVEKNLLDLNSKPGKRAGGYCTYIADYKAPFIFANFNGTSHDVDVLTHEAGHAFQVYSSRQYQVPEYMWPTLEACEIHSMSMEFLTWPWMKLFFENDEMKYKFTHLASGVLFIPYGVTVDEFQHFVYENPDATPEERKAQWRKVEKKYLPTKDYEDSAFLEKGGFWFRQGHIFGNPFYYIDYTLAQICAYQFWIKYNENPKEAWMDYVNLCKAGGSQPFLELVKFAKLKSPFEEDTIKFVSEPIKVWLDKIDDRKM
jgi:M3 family oligoendopeptidase